MMKRSGQVIIWVQSLAAGLLCSTLVSGLMLIGVQQRWLPDNDFVRLVMVSVSALTMVFVAATFRKNRGIDS